MGGGGTSAQVTAHSNQDANLDIDEKTGDLYMQKFDYGEEGNLKKYGSKVPPKYDETLIDCELHIISGGKDKHCNSDSHEKLAKKVNSSKDKPNVFCHSIPNFRHLDFTFPKTFTPLYNI